MKHEVPTEITGLGGARPGAGRPPKFSTLEAQQARNYIAERLRDVMPKLYEVMYKKAIKGDMIALKELLDRGFGKSRQQIGVEGGEEGSALVIQISELIANKNKLNGTD